MGTQTFPLPVDFEPQWLDEAVDSLRQYRIDPFTRSFVDKYNLPLLHTGRDMRELIKQKILNRSLPFEDLVAYTDELKMWGKQHVFLFHLKSKDAGYIRKLRSPDYIKKRLTWLGLDNRYNNNIHRWSSYKPFLAEVRHEVDSENESEVGWLRFKWIQTREYDYEISHNKYVCRSERSVNFLTINLTDGSAQLRIQVLHSRPHRNIDEELEIYKKQITGLVNWDHFTSTNLAGIMKQLLFRSKLPIAYSNIITCNGAIRISGAEPIFIEKMKSALQDVSLREIEPYWECKQKSRGAKHLFFKLNADRNDLVFDAVTDKSRIDYIVSQLYKTDNSFLKAKRKIAIVDEKPPEPLINKMLKRNPKLKEDKDAMDKTKRRSLGVYIIGWMLGTVAAWLLNKASTRFFGMPIEGMVLLIGAIGLILLYDATVARKYLSRIASQTRDSAIRQIFDKPTVEAIERGYDEYMEYKTDGGVARLLKDLSEVCDEYCQRLAVFNRSHGA